MSDAAPSHHPDTGDTTDTANADEMAGNTTPVERAHNHLNAHRDQVALLNLLTAHHLEIRDSHIIDAESVDGTLVSIETVVPDDWLTQSDQGIPDHASDNAHEATQLDDIESSIHGLKAHVDAISTRLDTLEERLDTVERTNDTLEAHIATAHDTDTDTDTDTATAASQDPTPDTASDIDSGTDIDPETETDAGDDTGDGTELTASALRAELLATVVDDVADSIKYFDKSDWRALADTHLDAEFDSDATISDLLAAFADAYSLEIDTSPPGGNLRKSDVRALYDAIIHDDTAADSDANPTVSAEPNDDGDSDEGDTAAGDSEDDASMPAKAANPVASDDARSEKNRATLAHEVALALGVEPNNPNTSSIPKHVIRDITAVLTTRSKAALVPKDKDALRQELAAFQDVDEWRGVVGQWRDLHATVVPDARLDGPIEWDALDAHVDIPAWLGEGTLVEAVGESESIRDLEHTLGWDGDRRQLRCITWLAGWYSDLPEPEAKHDSKYSMGGDA